MTVAAIAFKAYHRTAHAWERATGAFGAVHGHYDGLTTGTWTHDHLQLLVPLKGRIHLAWAQEALLAGPEHAVAILPGTPHAASTLDGAFEFLALNAPAGWLGALASEVAATAPARAGVVLLGHSGIWLQARQLAMALDAPLPGHERFLDAGVEQLGLYMVQALGAPGPEGGDRAVLAAIEAILAGYGDELSVAGLAAELAMSPRHLERRFKAALGVSPRRFLIDVRLAAARDLLTQTDMPVERVGERVGFTNPSHFARAFRAAGGVTPSAYRRDRRS